MTVPADFAEFVRERRSILGLTQQELARQAEVDARVIERIEEGQYEVSSTLMERLTSALDHPSGTLPRESDVIQPGAWEEFSRLADDW